MITPAGSSPASATPMPSPKGSNASSQIPIPGRNSEKPRHPAPLYPFRIWLLRFLPLSIHLTSALLLQAGVDVSFRLTNTQHSAYRPSFLSFCSYVGIIKIPHNLALARYLENTPFCTFSNKRVAVRQPLATTHPW